MIPVIARPGWEFLDSGHDSKVYRVNGYVAKVYDERMDIRTLQGYYSDTAKASSLMRTNKDYLTAHIAKYFDGCAIGITVLEQGHIRHVGPELLGGDSDDDKILLGIGQRYIDAENILGIYPLVYSCMESLVENFSYDLKNAVGTALSMMTRLIRRDTGITFDIDPANVKMSMDPGQKRLELIVTDLAASIERSYS